MSTVDSLSVLVCTYNRSRLLEGTLEALAAARPPVACAVDIVVVDNNSDDDTAEVVRRAQARGPWPVRYVFERAQGKSFALNTGLRSAAGEVLALTDDDVIPSCDWLVKIAEAFRTGELVFAFGKVLPRWAVAPPPELVTPRARDIWGPLALVDYGDQRVRYDDASFRKNRLPIGANLAVRRTAIEQINGWRTDLGKVDNSLIAGEDRDLCVRLFRAGLFSGLYDPTLLVYHHVPGERLTRRYFRRWFYWHGRTIARMADGIYPDLDLDQVPHVAGVPRFVYREFLDCVARWLGRVGRHDALALLMEEVKAVEYLGFFAESWRRQHRRHSGTVAQPSSVVRQHAE
jgi:glycosyltransferase involved in cell wall biosynthesis